VGRRKSRTLTEVELEFMQIVWPEEEVSTEDVQKALSRQDRDLSDGTVRKVLSILMDKGYLIRRRQGHAFYYKAKIPEQEARQAMAQDLVKRAFWGSSALMMAALFERRAVSEPDLEEIKRLIAEHEKESES
jgi:BlaI family transcriptional regulator, penicillinase repressor